MGPWQEALPIGANFGQSLALSSPLTQLWFHLVHWAFRQLYGPFAWAYDLVAWVVSRGEWHRWGRAALPWTEGGRVLELGCGPGHLLGELTAWGRVAVGLDLSPAMLRLARHRLRQRRPRPTSCRGRPRPTACRGRPRPTPCRLVHGRAQALPFADHAFDAVVVAFPAEFIGHPATLAEIARVLAPDGRFVLVDGGRHLGRDPWSRLLNWALDVTSSRERLGEVVRHLDSEEREDEVSFTVTHGQVRGTRSVVRVVVARRRGGSA